MWFRDFFSGITLFASILTFPLDPRPHSENSEATLVPTFDQVLVWKERPLRILIQPLDGSLEERSRHRLRLQSGRNPSHSNMLRKEGEGRETGRKRKRRKRRRSKKRRGKKRRKTEETMHRMRTTQNHVRIIAQELLMEEHLPEPFSEECASCRAEGEGGARERRTGERGRRIEEGGGEGRGAGG